MQRGYIALITVLIVMSVVLTTVSTVALFAIGEAQSGLALSKGEDALSFVEGCVEDAMLKARADANYSGGYIARPEGTCIITVISKVGSPTVTWTMKAQTDTTVTKYNRIIEVVFNRSGTGIALTSWKEVATF